MVIVRTAQMRDIAALAAAAKRFPPDSTVIAVKTLPWVTESARRTITATQMVVISQGPFERKIFKALFTVASWRLPNGSGTL